MAQHNTTFSERLREAMGPHMTAAELARDLSKTGRVKVSRMAVSKWMRGLTDNVRMAHLAETADLLRVDLRWLMTGDGSARPNPGARSALTQDEIALTGSWRKLPESARGPLLEYVEHLARHQIPKLNSK